MGRAGHPLRGSEAFAPIGCAGTLRIEAVADDGHGAVRVVWHNRYPSFAQALQSGRAAAIYGTPIAGPRGEMRIENPETELFDEGEEGDPLHSGGSCRSTTGGGHSFAALEDARPPDARFPLRGRRGRGVASPADLLQALETVHFRRIPPNAERARRTLAGEELLVLAARIEEKRARLRERRGVRLDGGRGLRERPERRSRFR